MTNEQEFEEKLNAHASVVLERAKAGAIDGWPSVDVLIRQGADTFATQEALERARGRYPEVQFRVHFIKRP